MKLKILAIVFCVFYLSLITSGQNTKKKSGKSLTISGIVVSLDKKPVAGAFLFVDSVKTGYKTDQDGSYKIKVDPSVRKLMVRSQEYGYSETMINGQTTINFTLNGFADKQTFNSMAAGKTDSIKKPAKPRAKKMNTYTDIYQMIRGEVYGVVVSGRSVRVQQGHSFLGSSEPLYVVNGNVVGSIDFVVPLEVKKIEILKGSAAAIYGLRGSNGVISITLKNGTEKE